MTSTTPPRDLEPSASIRPVVPEDVPALGIIVERTDMFPAEMLDGMLSGFFAGQAGDEFWLTVDDGAPVAVAYCIPEPMTEGTWNLLLIAVHPDAQGRGIGGAVMDHVEREVTARGARLLLVETSGLPAFERTRAFYRELGYHEEARIREFYDAGDDKVVFRKALSSPPRSAVTDAGPA